jgi:hypothetical protein
MKQASESAGLFNYPSVAEETARLSEARSFAQLHLWPLVCCLVAGFALSFMPIVIARLQTGMWVLLQREVEYYLQIAGQAYYNYPLYIRDPAVPGGVCFYTWLLFVPPVCLARAFGLSLFSVALIWMVFGCVGVSAGLYFVFWQFLRRPWIAAGLTIFCLSNFRFSTPVPLNYQLKAIFSALILHPHGIVDLTPVPVWEWRRVPDPAVGLPFLFIQIIAVSIARQRPKLTNAWLSGLAFGLLFYVYYYIWTMVAAALCIAMLFDSGRRKVYFQTLLVGLACGIPELVHLFRLREEASIEALARFSAFSAAAPNSVWGIPWISIAAIAVVGLWIWTTSKVELTYLWSLAAAGILLGCSPLITGIFMHAYHWTWLMLPIRAILVLLLVATVVTEKVRRLPAFNWAFTTLVAFYFIGGLYLAAIVVTRTKRGAEQLNDYTKYRSQRLLPGVNSLTSNSVIAGDDDFCELAAIGENQRDLSDEYLNVSMAVDNAEWRSRFALNVFLNGTTDRAVFQKKANDELEGGLWTVRKITPELMAPFMNTYDQILRDPNKFISAYAVRYVALPVARRAPDYLRNGWTLIQAGPYWQLWERKGSSESNPKTNG